MDNDKASEIQNVPATAFVSALQMRDGIVTPNF
jgi:hypothetical protein